MEQTGLEIGIILGSEIVIPTKTHHLVPSILPLGSSTVTTFFPLFYRATFPAIEMSSHVLRDRLEGEATVGHKHGLLSSKEEAHSNRVSNVMTSHKGELGWSGHHTAEVRQCLQNTPAPAALGKGCVY